MRPNVHLFIDADDTLWENNIYFERAFDEFVGYLNHSTLSPAEVRAVLDEIELVNNKVHGYGSLNFGRNLVECYHRLCERHIDSASIQAVMHFAEKIREQPIELLPGVPPTLAYLSSRHHLTLFTKGHFEEQKLKVDRSGLARYFNRILIVKEKDESAYRAALTQQPAVPESTWMIGNSPKSDINPALAAGLNAVYIHHPHTWHLEKTELSRGPGNLLELSEFAELREWF